MIIDFHNHTTRSHDAFTTTEQLALYAYVRGIGAIAITDHDVADKVDDALFKEYGVQLIQGCEYTAEQGVHIIGLFTNVSLPPHAPRSEVLDAILDTGGLPLMPHPFKPCSGYLAKFGADKWVAKFKFAELVNGGFLNFERNQDLRLIAYESKIILVASSDSHRPRQVGTCVSRITGVDDSTGETLKHALKNMTQAQIELLIDKDALRQHGRRVTTLQKSSLYQASIRLIPSSLRRNLKKCLFRRFQDSLPEPPKFEVYQNFHIDD